MAKAKYEKDVKTPFQYIYNAHHAVNGVANCRETRLGAADLTAAADAFEASFANTASATAEHVAATADTSAKIREGMIIVRVLDGIVQNKYRMIRASWPHGFQQATSKKGRRNRHQRRNGG